MKPLLKFAAIGVLLVGLPLLGAGAVPATWTEMFELPPRTAYVSHAPFSWPAFAGLTVFILAWVTPFVIRAVRGGAGPAVRGRAGRRFPWWGWAALAAGGAGWGLSWTRFEWFAPLQRHTYLFVWLPYIVVANALTQRRTGRCLMLDRSVFFALLFPVSSLFWWFFEYLNRFVQNWNYVEVHRSADGTVCPMPLQFTPLAYLAFATLAFSTVLPAVLSTRDWLLSMGWMERFRSARSIRIQGSRRAAWAVLILTGAGLAGIGAWPDYLFPLLWISPLLMLLCIQELCGERHVFSSVPCGDWRPVVSAALAALICGFFWEMWNAYSMAKWVYQVPFVSTAHVFEMPLLGYAGYLPFGLECAVLSGALGGAVVGSGRTPISA